MSSHLEVWKPSGRELIPLTGQRVTLGKASTNAVSLEHDETVSRLHAVFENLGFAWSIRDMGSRNGTYLNGEAIAAERVLRSGDEVRVGKSRLIFWEVKDTGDTTREEETKSAQALELPPRLTPRELDVLMVLCRPLVSDDPFPEPDIGSADGERTVRDRGSSQAASAEPLRQVLHPHRGRPPGPSGERGASARSRHHRPATRRRCTRKVGVT